MSIAEIIRQAQSDGIAFKIAAPEGLKLVGKPEVVQRWLPVLRPQKSEIFDALLHDDRRRIMTAMSDWGERVAMMSCSRITNDQAELFAWNDLDLDAVFFGFRRINS